MDHCKVPVRITDSTESSDIEVVMRLLRLFDAQDEGRSVSDRQSNERLYVKMAEKALETMTNPFARKLLLDRIGGESIFSP